MPRLRLPHVLLVLFITLFAEANPVFTLWLSAINWDPLIDYLSFSRLMFWCVVASLCWAVIRPKFNATQKAAPCRGLQNNPSTLPQTWGTSSRQFLSATDLPLNIRILDQPSHSSQTKTLQFAIFSGCIHYQVTIAILLRNE